MGSKFAWPFFFFFLSGFSHVSNKSTTHINQLLLLLLRHVSQAVVASGQVVLQAGQGRHHHPLHLAALSPGAGRRQAQAADAAASADAGGQDVVPVENAVGELRVEEEKKERECEG